MTSPRTRTRDSEHSARGPGASTCPYKETENRPGPVAPLIGELSHAPRGCGFDSQSGHMCM